MASNDGYVAIVMLISVADGKDQSSRLIRALEEGKEVIIRRSGKPVESGGKRKVRWSALKRLIQLKPGWDDAIREEQLRFDGVPARHKRGTARRVGGGACLNVRLTRAPANPISTGTGGSDPAGLCRAGAEIDSLTEQTAVEGAGTDEGFAVSGRAGTAGG